MTSTGHRGLVIASAIAVLLAVAVPAAPGAATASTHIERIDSLRLAMRADSALALIRGALPGAEASADSALFLALRVRQGELLTSLGDARAGEAVLRGALRLAKAQADSSAITASIRWLSVAVASQGRTAEARALYHELRTIARVRGDAQHEGWAEVGFGWDAIHRGAGAEALERYQRAVDLFRSARESRGEAWALNGLGTALSSTGRHDDARDAFRAAGLLAAAIPYPMVACFAANNLGDLEYQLGDPAAAVTHFEDAARINRAIGNTRESIVPTLNIAICETELGRTRAAADSLTRLLALCRAERYAGLEAAVRIRLAETRRVQGRTRDARMLYESVLDLGDRSPLKNRVEAMIGLARVAADSTESRAACRMIAKALASPEMSAEGGGLAIELTNALASGRLAAGDAHHARTLAARAATGAAHLGRRDQELPALAVLGRSRWVLGDTSGARRAFERARRVWEEQRALPGDPEWRESRGAIGRLLTSDLAALTLASGEPVGTAYSGVQAFKARTLYERMSGPERPGAPASPAIALDRLQHEVLAEGELLLDFYLGSPHSLLFAVRRDSCRVIMLPAEEEIVPPIRLYHDLVSAPPGGGSDLAAIDGAAAALRRLLTRGAEDWIAASDRVIVVPDGALNLVSLGDFDVPSAAILADIRARRARAADDRGPLRVLALVDGRSAGKPLPGANEEAGYLAQHYRHAIVRRFSSADTVPVSGLAIGRDVLHIASHAAADDERPWQSSLFLGGGGLRAADLANANLPFRLAVLSSCQSLHGRILSGEGVLGLSSALLAAGTECVVATRWPVDDRVTAALMEVFYRELAAGRTVAGALARAQMEIRRDPRTAHPFYWAGFTAIGAGDATIPLSRRVMPASYAMMAALLVAGSCLLAMLANRRHVTRPLIHERLP